MRLHPSHGDKGPIPPQKKGGVPGSPSSETEAKSSKVADASPTRTSKIQRIHNNNDAHPIGKAFQSFYRKKYGEDIDVTYLAMSLRKEINATKNAVIVTSGLGGCTATALSSSSDNGHKVYLDHSVNPRIEENLRRIKEFIFKLSPDTKKVLAIVMCPQTYIQDKDCKYISTVSNDSSLYIDLLRHKLPEGSQIIVKPYSKEIIEGPEGNNCQADSLAIEIDKEGKLKYSILSSSINAKHINQIKSVNLS